MSQQERNQEKDYQEGQTRKQNIGNQEESAFQRQQRQPGKENVQPGKHASPTGPAKQNPGSRPQQNEKQNKENLNKENPKNRDENFDKPNKKW